MAQFPVGLRGPTYPRRGETTRRCFTMDSSTLLEVAAPAPRHLTLLRFGMLLCRLSHSEPVSSRWGTRAECGVRSILLAYRACAQEYAFKQFSWHERRSYNKEVWERGTFV